MDGIAKDKKDSNTKMVAAAEATGKDCGEVEHSQSVSGIQEVSVFELGENSAEVDRSPETKGCEKDGEAPLSVHLLTEILGAGVDQILNAFEQKLAYDGKKQQQIDRLHAELQDYRTDLIAKMNRPLINGLIRLHDDVGKLIDNFKKKSVEELESTRFYRAFADVQSDIEILLDQNGVISFSEQGKNFEPRRQRVVRKIKTSEKQLDGTIAGRLRKGFEQADDMIQKERVSIYAFDELTIQQGDCSDDELKSKMSQVPDADIPSNLEKN